MYKKIYVIQILFLIGQLYNIELEAKNINQNQQQKLINKIITHCQICHNSLKNKFFEIDGNYYHKDCYKKNLPE